MAKRKANPGNTHMALSPAVVAATGLNMAAASGVDAVSIRKIADELGVTPMAIYRHFSSKEALLAAMLDLFIIEADVLPREPLAWPEWLQHVGMAMYRALCQSPSWIPLFGRLQLRPGALAVMESYLGVMQQAGFSHEQAARGFFGLLQNLIGAATMHSAFAGMDTAETALAGLDAGQYPAVTAALPGIARALSSDLMQNGLRLLLDGLMMEREKHQPDVRA